MTHKEKMPAYSSHLVHALQFACHIHASQRRKGSEVPYLSHLLAVSALVMDYGGSEAEAIGALLHDAAEDCGGRAMLEQIRATFGDAVAEIVEGCTDTFDDPKPEWRLRKEAYLRHLTSAPDPVRFVACADKLHNLLCTVRDLRGRPGPDYWDRFAKSKKEQLWYYGECLKAFQTGKAPAMLPEYEIAWREFVELTK